MKGAGQLTAAWMLALVALAGCAAYGPQRLKPGASVDDVKAALGPPTAQYPAAGGGERVEYARGPYGKHTFMLDFDGQGRLSGWQQVLDEPYFDALRTGTARDDVLRTLGHPAEQRSLGLQHRTVWSYRYETPFCKWFQVVFDRQGRVVETGYGPDPLCDVGFERDAR